METLRRYTSGNLPSLDGWRALSVCLVLFAHSHPPQSLQNAAFFCGVIGVRFFFVISGFLITWLLLRERMDRGKINLRAFYTRRAFRILPVYFFFLAIYAVLELHALNKISAWQWIANLSFTANYSNSEGPTSHLWTLGVEEQFYLIWPFAFLLCTRDKQQPNNYNKLILILLLTLAACPVIRGICYLTPQEQIPIFFNRFSFPRHADEIGWGCMTALILWTRPAIWNIIEKHALKTSGTGLTLIMLPWFAGPINGFNAINVPLAPAMQSIGFALLMLCSIQIHKHPIYSWLNIKPISLIGILSYSIYIWHPLFSPSQPGWATLAIGNLKQFPWWPIAAVAVAAISYWGLEKPFLELRKKFTTHK